MQVLGFDIGGANIKASDADGRTAAVTFPMWTQHLQLPEALASLAAKLCPEPDMVAATMTAELADCFATKAEGVEYVIGAIQQAFPSVPIRIWMTSGEFCLHRRACFAPPSPKVPPLRSPSPKAAV